MKKKKKKKTGTNAVAIKTHVLQNINRSPPQVHINASMNDAVHCLVFGIFQMFCKRTSFPSMPNFVSAALSVHAQ
jgi:hypothetical protein